MTFCSFTFSRCLICVAFSFSLSIPFTLSFPCFLSRLSLFFLPVSVLFVSKFASSCWWFSPCEGFSLPFSLPHLPRLTLSTPCPLSFFSLFVLFLSGIAIDPRNYTVQELEKITRAYALSLIHHNMLRYEPRKKRVARSMKQRRAKVCQCLLFFFLFSLPFPLALSFLAVRLLCLACVPLALFPSVISFLSRCFFSVLRWTCLRPTSTRAAEK